MSWRDRMVKASFKGVEFHVDGEAFRGGRRIIRRHLAGKDGSRQHDAGQNEDEGNVEAFLFGDDYDVARGELEAVLRSAGSGPLVLPSRGEATVRIVGDVETTQKRGEGGYCSIRFSYVVEEPAEQRLRSVPDRLGLLGKVSKALKTIAVADFSSTFDVLAMPGAYISQVSNAVTGVTQNLRNIQGKINGTMNPLEDLTAAIDDFDSTFTSLFSTPSVLASKLSDLVSSVYDLANNSGTILDRSTGLSGFEGSPFERSLAVRTTYQTSLNMKSFGSESPANGLNPLETRKLQAVRAVYRLARTIAIAQQANTYTEAPFDSSSTALAILESNMDEISALQDFSATDDLFFALADQRSALAAFLTQVASSLPLTVTIAQRQEVPALLLAHQLYGDARLESELVLRNLPRYPLFMSGDLEVLEP
jgi:prophage DNA circulation protein